MLICMMASFFCVFGLCLHNLILSYVQAKKIEIVLRVKTIRFSDSNHERFSVQLSACISNTEALHCNMIFLGYLCFFVTLLIRNIAITYVSFNFLSRIFWWKLVDLTFSMQRSAEILPLLIAHWLFLNSRTD